MNEKIICFSLGLSEEDMEKGRNSFYERNRDAPRLEVIALSGQMLDKKVVDVLEDVITDPESCGVKKQQPDNAMSPGRYKYRVVVVLTHEREQVLQVMRSFKAVLPDPQDIIFAVITGTVLKWTFADYIGHLGEEHESMNNRNPGDENR